VRKRLRVLFNAPGYFILLNLYPTFQQLIRAFLYIILSKFQVKYTFDMTYIRLLVVESSSRDYFEKKI
jgi:hypothetical protein